jgi:hypothetical protein
MPERSAARPRLRPPRATTTTAARITDTNLSPSLTRTGHCTRARARGEGVAPATDGGGGSGGQLIRDVVDDGDDVDRLSNQEHWREGRWQ